MCRPSVSSVLINRYLPKELSAPPWMKVLLYIGAAVITVFVLVSEGRRWGLLQF